MYLYWKVILHCLSLVYRDNPQIDLLFSIAILILVYFIVLQTFFAGKRSMHKSYEEAIDDDVSRSEQKID